MPGGRPPAFKTPKDLQKAVDSYFTDCVETGITVKIRGEEVTVPEPFTVSGLAHHLGVHRDTIHSYANEKGDEYSDTIKKAIARIERDKVAKATMGFYDKTISIFDLKNNHGWKDVKGVEMDDKRKPERAMTETEIDKRLQELQGRKAANG